MQSGVMPPAKCLDWDASALPRGKGREDKLSGRCCYRAMNPEPIKSCMYSSLSHKARTLPMPR